jgi:hypothetical protein
LCRLPRYRRDAHLIGLLLVAAAGCSSHSFAGPPACIVGSGEFAFVPFDASSVIPIVMGPQGGYHIWGSTLVRYMDATTTTQRYTMTVAATGMQVEVNAYSDAFTAVDPATLPAGGDAAVAGTQDGWGESLGHRVFVMDPASIDMVGLRMKVELTSSDGRTCVDERAFTPHRVVILGLDGGTPDLALVDAQAD